MKRLYRLQRMYLDEIERHTELTERDCSLHWEKIHMASSARIAFMLAEQRGVNTELAAIACTIHDIGRVFTGKQKDHAHAGYEPAKQFLGETGLFTQEEIEMLARAVYHHSSKAEVGTPVEEIVKDADVLDCHMYGQELPRQEQRDRLAALLKELNLK